MSTDHDHGAIKESKERPLILALILTTAFLIAEVAGGIITGSLALISDAAHMLTDVTALAIALMAIKIGRRPADMTRTFGYYRFEILAAAFNTILLFLVAIYILYEAYQRLLLPPEVNSTGMLIIASIGLVVNLVSMRLLTYGKDKNLNMKAAYLEVFSDMLGSVGVIIGALIIRFTGWAWVDLVVAVLIGLWVLPRTWILLKQSINVLLESVPENIELKEIDRLVRKIDGVADIHDLHVWAITTDKISLTAHVIIHPQYDCDKVLPKIRELLASKFGITHTTLQDERIKCQEGVKNCNF